MGPAKDLGESLVSLPFPHKVLCYNSLLSPTPAHSPPLSPFLTTYYIVYDHARPIGCFHLHLVLVNVYFCHSNR